MRPLGIITGGTSGIGFAIAQKLSLTHDLVLVYKDRHDNASVCVDRLKAVTPELQVALFSGDLANTETPESIVAMTADHFKEPPSVLVNAAGHAQSELFMSSKMDSLEAFITVHLLATIRLTHAILPTMYRNRFGRIINFSSVLSDCTVRGTSAYATAKAAIEAFTKCVALEVFHRGVTVNAIKPGLVDTPMTTSVRHANPNRNAIPASDVADLAMYLLSPSANHITGSVMAIAPRHLPQERHTTL